MTHRGAGQVLRECSNWYFLGMFIWIGIIIFIILFAGGFGEVPSEFFVVRLFFFGIVGISALVLYSVRSFRNTSPHRSNLGLTMCE
ncbi:MAG: hypothetical protein ACFFCH_08765 [Promethearchaeota archaeon]